MGPTRASVGSLTFARLAGTSMPHLVGCRRKKLRLLCSAAMVKVMDAPDSAAPAPLACKVCRKSADACHSASWVGLRRGLCRACYLREWRGTALPEGAACTICKERRRIVLRWTKVGTQRIVTCQNCGFVADKARPRPRTVEELHERMLRERR